METSISLPRRTFLKTASLATLFNLAVPLQSLAESHSSSADRHKVRRLECPNCHATHMSKMPFSSCCQTSGVNLLNPTLAQKILK